MAFPDSVQEDRIHLVSVAGPACFGTFVTVWPCKITLLGALVSERHDDYDVAHCDLLAAACRTAF